MELLGLTTAELESALQEMGEPAFRGRQVAQWIYRKGARSFEEMNNLSRDLRAKLTATHTLGFPAVASSHLSRDGANKLLLEMEDGERIETVRLPYPDRLSLCVSSQAGCAMACVFCATGIGGIRRNLTTAEIIAQALMGMRAVEEGEVSPPLSHVVFMGMGEPMHNYDNVLKAIHLMHDEIGVPMRHITLSTVGILRGIERLAAEKLQLTLAISLHAPFDELRHRLIPTAKKTSVKDIVAAARAYVATTGRRVTFEYVVLGGVNDGLQEARELARLCRGWPSHVNLIPWNAVPDAAMEGAHFHPPHAQDLKAFKAALERDGVTVTQRVQRGADVAAACGQLRANSIPLPMAG